MVQWMKMVLINGAMKEKLDEIRVVFIHGIN